MSITMLTKRSESRRLCLVPDLNGEAFSLSPLSMIRWYRSYGYDLYLVFIKFIKFPSILNLLRMFVMHRCWILSNVSVSVNKITWSFFFSLWRWWIPLLHLWQLIQDCIPGINPIWSWSVILFIHCWIRFSIILRNFASRFMRDIDLHFYLYIFVWFW